MSLDFADAVITVPDVDSLLAPILLAVPAQILAYPDRRGKRH